MISEKIFRATYKLDMASATLFFKFLLWCVAMSANFASLSVKPTSGMNFVSYLNYLTRHLWGFGGAIC